GAGVATLAPARLVSTLQVDHPGEYGLHVAHLVYGEHAEMAAQPVTGDGADLLGDHVAALSQRRDRYPMEQAGPLAGGQRQDGHQRREHTQVEVRGDHDERPVAGLLVADGRVVTEPHVPALRPHSDFHSSTGGPGTRSNSSSSAR